MQALLQGDLDAFMASEAESRRDGEWPPYGRLAALIVSADTAIMADTVARDLGWAAPRGDGIVVLGPAPAPMALLRGRHRRRLLLKVRRDVPVQPILRSWLAVGEGAGDGAGRCGRRPDFVSVDRVCPVARLPRRTRPMPTFGDRIARKAHVPYDRRRSHRRQPAAARHRYGVRTARRADLWAVRRLRPDLQPPAPDQCAARADHGLHGAGLCLRDRPAGGLCRGAGPGRAEHHGGAGHRLGGQCAGAVPDRPGAQHDDRPPPRPVARTAGPARHAADAAEMGRTDRSPDPGAVSGGARVPGDAVRPPRPGGAGDAVGPVHRHRRGHPARPAAAASEPGARSGKDQRAWRSC